jgi:hypothetical protein
MHQDNAIHGKIVPGKLIEDPGSVDVEEISRLGLMEELGMVCVSRIST